MADTIESNAFDPDQPATYERYSEVTPDGGKIVLVRYPEGYRLRFNGEVVWREGDEPTPRPTISVTIEGGARDQAVRELVRKSVNEALNDAKLAIRRGDVVMSMYEQCVGWARKS